MSFPSSTADMSDEMKRQLLQIAHLRLHPSLTNPNYLVLQSRRKILAKWFSELPKKHLDVLVVGGRYQPYRPLLRERSTRYLAIDPVQTALVDIIGNGEQLPFARETFDVVIATEVFQYFSEPSRAALEANRVLKPGGFLFLSVPAFA